MIRLFTLLLIFNVSFAFSYPAHWWGPTQSEQPVPDWEILPEEGVYGESVILSKRNELSILSNFAPTSSFVMDGKSMLPSKALAVYEVPRRGKRP